MTGLSLEKITMSDADFLRAIEATEPKIGNWVFLWHLAEHLGAHPNRVRSKARRVWRRGLLDGCMCGCRGDFELTAAGRELLEREAPTAPAR